MNYTDIENKISSIIGKATTGSNNIETFSDFEIALATTFKPITKFIHGELWLEGSKFIYPYGFLKTIIFFGLQDLYFIINDFLNPDFLEELSSLVKKEYGDCDDLIVMCIGLILGQFSKDELASKFSKNLILLNESDILEKLNPGNNFKIKSQYLNKIF